MLFLLLWDIYASKAARLQLSGKLVRVNRIRFSVFLFVSGGNISRIDNNAINAKFSEPPADPKTTETGFIDNMEDAFRVVFL